jgi:hypothetical protein
LRRRLRSGQSPLTHIAASPSSICALVCLPIRPARRIWVFISSTFRPMSNRICLLMRYWDG